MAFTAGETFEPRTLVVDVATADGAKAYTMSAIEKQSPILDIVGTTEIVIFIGEDRKSVRAFQREIDGEKTLEFFVKPETVQIVDAETGSVWDFSGKAVSGALAGKQLKKISVQKDFWFDWKIYHPNTQIYAPGAR